MVKGSYQAGLASSRFELEKQRCAASLEPKATKRKR